MRRADRSLARAQGWASAPRRHRTRRPPQRGQGPTQRRDVALRADGAPRRAGRSSPTGLGARPAVLDNAAKSRRKRGPYGPLDPVPSRRRAFIHWPTCCRPGNGGTQLSQRLGRQPALDDLPPVGAPSTQRLRRPRARNCATAETLLWPVPDLPSSNPSGTVLGTARRTNPRLRESERRPVPARRRANGTPRDTAPPDRGKGSAPMLLGVAGTQTGLTHGKRSKPPRRRSPGSCAHATAGPLAIEIRPCPTPKGSTANPCFFHRQGEL